MAMKRDTDYGVNIPHGVHTCLLPFSEPDKLRT